MNVLIKVESLDRYFMQKIEKRIETVPYAGIFESHSFDGNTEWVIIATLCVAALPFLSDTVCKLRDRPEIKMSATAEDGTTIEVAGKSKRQVKKEFIKLMQQHQ